MDDPSESASALPWLWVIEALAGFKKINSSTLQDLIDVAPVVPDDFGENTTELVALKCLEELFGSHHEINHDASSSLDSRVGFDFSQSCEEVIQKILHKIPLANLEMADAESLKWDVSPFIMHKRASTAKCHLEQLKESIIEATHPHTDYLKERSGLALGNGVYPVHVNVHECNDLSGKDNGSSTSADNMGAKENSVFLVSENGNRSSKEHLLDNNFLPSKRNKVYSADEHAMEYLNEKQVCMNECDDFLRNTKKIKCQVSLNFESKKEKPVSLLGKGVSENSNERIIQVSEKGGHQTEKDNRATLHAIEDSHDRCTASNQCCSSHNEVFHDESNIPVNATVMPQHTFGGEDCQQQQVEPIPANVALPDELQHKISGNEPWSKHETDSRHRDPNGHQQTVACDIAQDDASNGCRAEISGDKIVDQDENINLSTKKHEVLIPQRILGPDSTAFTELTDQNLYMKCNKSGQLLVCDTTTLPLAVPDICLGMITTIMPKHTSGDEPCQCTSLDETNDTEQRVVDDADKIDHMFNEPQSQFKEQNTASSNISQKAVACDKAVVHTVHGCQSESSSDSDGCHNENFDLAAKKHRFLSSQSTLGYDFSASTEQNLCMKCNESGQLLVCKTTTCPLMVHKNCLGLTAQFDVNGNFFCPFCAYSHAISEYLEAKKKASSARKELAIFINKGIRHRATELLHEFHKQEHSLARKGSKCENIHVENNGNGHLSGSKDNREDHVGELVNEINRLRFERSKQQGPASCIHSSCRENEIVNSRVVEVLSEEERVDMLNLKSSTGGRVEEKYVPTDHLDGDGGDKSVGQNTNIVTINQINTEEIPQEMLKQHHMNGTVEPDCAHDTEKKKFSEDEFEKDVISRYTFRLQKRETQYKPQASPQLRRKKIPWTVEEEELIREGVQKFGFIDQKIPWKKILAFGSHVFEKHDKHRTPQDLKDKWKNMCRAHSKRK